MLKYFFIAYLALIGFLVNDSCAQNQLVADSLIKLIDKNKEFHDSILFSCYIKIAVNTNNAHQIMEYGEKAFILASTMYDYTGMAQSKALVGSGYMMLGNLVNALSFHFESIEYYEQSKKWDGMATGYNNVADVYSIQGDHQNSIFYYKRAISLFKKAGDNWRLAMALSNTGDEFFNANELDSALLYINQSNTLYDELDYAVGRAYNYGNIGLIYAKKGITNLGEKFLNESIYILEKYGDIYAISEFQIEMANIYIEKGNKAKALSYAMESYKIAIENGFKKQIKNASLKLSELYSLSGKFQKAYKYQSIYITYRDSINNEKVIRKMADLLTEYEVSKKQTEVDLLDKAKQTQKIIGAGLILLLTLSGVLIYVLNKNNRHKLNTNIILAKQKEELQIQHDELDKLNSFKDKLFSIVSHDLRGPIGAISGISDIIKQSIENNDMKQLTLFAGYLNISVDQLSTLLDNLLDWAMNQQDEFPFNPEQIQLELLIYEIILIFATTAKAKNISIQVNIDKNISLLADKNSLMSIFRNLISNAIKFTYDGGFVNISGELNTNSVIVKVSDTGIGMSEEKMNLLFNGKNSQSTRGTANEKGLGLGLNLAYEFAAMNKAKIKVISTLRKGTTFTIEFPVIAPLMTKAEYRNNI